MKSNIVTLIMGDPSHDGHNMEEKITYSSSHTVKEIKAAYEKSCELLGFDFVESCCTDYEDRSIEEDKVNILIKHGILFVAPNSGKDGYCPTLTCEPCYSGLCVREGDWIERDEVTEYLYDENKNYTGYKMVPGGRGLAMDGGCESHARIYIDIVKLSLPDLVMTVCSDYKNEIDIGGYGLFSC